MIRIEGATPEEREASLASIASSEAIRRRKEIEEHIIGLLRAAKKRAKAKNVPFALTADFLRTLLEGQAYRCAVTGLDLDLWKTGRRRVLRRRPLRPSIDRIEPSLGYVPSNVRIVCIAANVALNEWGEDVFRMMAEGFLRTNPHRRTD